MQRKMPKFSIQLFSIILGLLTNSIEASPINNGTSSVLNVVVIGAGASGLVSEKYAIEQGFKVTVYEQSEELGGIWFYTNKTGKDKYGNNIHSAMYKNLRTNTPVQILEFKDHHYPNNTPSYARSEDVLMYLQSYADRFDLRKYIKFNYLVIRVHPIENGKWEIIVKDLPNDKYETMVYDAVFVCNGHYSMPYWPQIQGANTFNGKIIHSHDFRTVDSFLDEKVLVIGSGASGIDIVNHLSTVTSQITLSTNKITSKRNEKRVQAIRENLPKPITMEYNVKRFTTNGAEFINGTHKNFTRVIYATGYNFSYPFLSVDTGIQVNNNFVQPLYKHVFNINYPTMAFIGLARAGITFTSFDLQARFAVKFISGAKKIPYKLDMLNDMWKVTENHWNKEYPVHHTHIFWGSEQRDYHKQLADTANIENIPEVLLNIESDVDNEQFFINPFGFRNFNYFVLDDKNFRREKI